MASKVGEGKGGREGGRPWSLTLKTQWARYQFKDLIPKSDYGV